MGILEDYMRQQAEARQQAQAQAKRDALLAMGMSLLGTRKGQELEGLGRAGLLGLATARNTAIPEGPSLRDMLALQEFQAKQDAAKQAEAQRAALEGKISGVWNRDTMGPAALENGQGPTPANAERFAQVVPVIEKYRQQAAIYAQAGRTEDAKRLADLAKTLEVKYSPSPQVMMQGDKPVFNLVSETGDVKTLPFGVPPKIRTTDLGGSVQVADEYTMKPGTVLPKTVSPDTQYTGNITMRGQNMSDSRMREQNAIAQGTAAQGRAGELRREFNALPQVKAYGEVQPVLQSVREAMNTDTAAADLNLIYGAAKIFDPTSVVRESETTMVVQSGSPAQRFLGQFNYVAGGGRLTPEARKQLIAQIESRGRGYESGYKAARKAYETVADRTGVPKDQVFVEPFAPSQPAPQAMTKLTPQEQAELDALRRRFGKR